MTHRFGPCGGGRDMSRPFNREAVRSRRYVREAVRRAKQASPLQAGPGRKPISPCLRGILRL